MLANEMNSPPNQNLQALGGLGVQRGWRQTWPSAGRIQKVQKSGAGRWYLELARGLSLDVSLCPRQAGDIYPADMVGGSMGRLEPWMC